MNNCNTSEEADNRHDNNDLNIPMETLDLITACYSPTAHSLARHLAHIIDSNKSVSEVIVFYIDASNTFPLYQFAKLIPKDGEAETIYESIRVQIALNLTELAMILRKILQFVSREKVTRHLNKSDEPGGLKILIVISGIEVMFENSKMSLPEEHHHTILRDSFLRLRVEANHSSNLLGLTLRTIVLVPFQDYQKFQPSRAFHSLNAKRQKTMTQVQNENSIGDYIIKFYADTLISLP